MVYFLLNCKARMEKQNSKNDCHVPATEEVLHIESNFRRRTALEESKLGSIQFETMKILLNRKAHISGLVVQRFLSLALLPMYKSMTHHV